MKKRNGNGQFIKTTGSTTYKKVMYGGINMQEHQRNFCIIMGINKIPKGFIIHHIDKNKKNNDIDNLALMTITAHNRIHSHKPWNKGLNTKDSEKWNNTIKKAVEHRKSNYVAIKGKEVYELKLTGITLIEVAKKLGITRETAGRRLRVYLEHKKLIDPSQKNKIDRFNRIKELRYSKGLPWEKVGEIMKIDGNLARRFYKRFLNIKTKLV
jgi:hypothetical protein